MKFRLPLDRLSEIHRIYEAREPLLLCTREGECLTQACIIEIVIPHDSDRFPQASLYVELQGIVLTPRVRTSDPVVAARCSGSYDDLIADGNLTSCSVREGCERDGCPARKK